MTLTNILKSFSKTLAQLDKLVSQNEARMVANQETIAMLDKENRALSDEAQRALAVSAKIKDLIA